MTGAQTTPLVLVVDDDPGSLVQLMTPLLHEGYRVLSAQSAQDALVTSRDVAPEAVIMKFSLPDRPGTDLCTILRTFTDACLMVCGTGISAAERLASLEAGADDVLDAPVDPREVVMRVGAMLRRSGRGEAAAAPVTELQPADLEEHREPAAASPQQREHPVVLSQGSLTMDVAAREVTVDGVDVSLTRIEFELLRVLMEQPNVVLSRGTLMDHIWGPAWFGDPHVLEAHVSKLRKKLGDDARNPRFVRVVRGVGYRLGGCSWSSEPRHHDTAPRGAGQALIAASFSSAPVAAGMRLRHA